MLLQRHVKLLIRGIMIKGGRGFMKASVRVELVSSITVSGVELDFLFPCANKQEVLKKLGLEKFSDIVNKVSIEIEEEKTKDKIYGSI